MSLPLFVIRPEPGFSATVEAARDLGLAAGGEPLFEIRPHRWKVPPANEIDGLLLGSANALRHGGNGLAIFMDKPAYTVGATTAQAARARGLHVAEIGSGGLQGVVDALEGRTLRLLRLAGADHVPLDLPDGVSVVTRIVYESARRPIKRKFAARLREGGVVMLHSAAAAEHFARECDRLGIPRIMLALAGLGPRIIAAAGEGWREVGAATSPREDALLALAQDLCH